MGKNEKTCKDAVMIFKDDEIEKSFKEKAARGSGQGAGNAPALQNAGPTMKAAAPAPKLSVPTPSWARGGGGGGMPARPPVITQPPASTTQPHERPPQPSEE